MHRKNTNSMDSDKMTRFQIGKNFSNMVYLGIQSIILLLGGIGCLLLQSLVIGFILIILFVIFYIRFNSVAEEVELNIIQYEKENE